ncbi:YceI family protein [Candidatus Kapabacteria bacterium]|nr:YceI family protein [Candidatus Kapabacteria bacterium]
MSTKWEIDSVHSEVAFKVKHMMISTVRGHFDNFNVLVETEGDNFENAKISVEIDVSSINTKNSDRDNHLKSDDFFNADKFGKMTFVSKSLDGDKLKGDLTIRDTTKELTLDIDYNGIAVDPYGQTKAGFELAGEISRKDFGLTWNAVTEAGSVVVSDKVKIVIDAQMIKKA